MIQTRWKEIYEIKKYSKESNNTKQISGEISILAYDIWREHYEPITGLAQVEYMLEKYQSPEHIYDDIKDNGFIYFTAESIKDNKLVGYAACQPRDDCMYLSKLYIQKDYRGNGISRCFINIIEELCRNEFGLNKIRLTVNKYNKNSIAVYNKIGFETVDSVKVDIGGGFYMDDYVMELIIGHGECDNK